MNWLPPEAMQALQFAQALQAQQQGYGDWSAPAAEAANRNGRVNAASSVGTRVINSGNYGAVSVGEGSSAHDLVTDSHAYAPGSQAASEDGARDASQRSVRVDHVGGRVVIADQPNSYSFADEEGNVYTFNNHVPDHQAMPAARRDLLANALERRLGAQVDEKLEAERQEELKQVRENIELEIAIKRSLDPDPTEEDLELAQNYAEQILSSRDDSIETQLLKDDIQRVICPILTSFPKIPVALKIEGGQIYDLNSLADTIKANGKGISTLHRKEFTYADINPFDQSVEYARKFIKDLIVMAKASAEKEKAVAESEMKKEGADQDVRMAAASISTNPPGGPVLN